MDVTGIGFINPEDMPQPHPDNVGMGEATCRCGGVSLTKVQGYGAFSVLVGCPTCGEWSEAAVLPPAPLPQPPGDEPPAPSDDCRTAGTVPESDG